MKALETTTEARLEFQRRIRETVKRTLTPAPRIKLADWCDKNRILPQSAPEPGLWNTDRAPYQREMLNVAGDRHIQKVVFMTSARVGKTSVIENVVAFHIAHDPTAMMVVLPSDNLVRAFSTDNLDPMIRDVPALRERVVKKNARVGGNSVSKKTFPGGHLSIVSSASAANLRARSIRVLLCDEVDAFVRDVQGEGDPLVLADARTRNYWNRKIILASTPKLEQDSHIAKEFLASDMRFYFVPCPHCQTMQRLLWRDEKGFRLQKDDKGEPVYICDNGCLIYEEDKPQMLAKGEWRKTNPQSLVAGFHIHSLYSPWTTWKDVLEQWWQAQNKPAALQTFFNTMLGETWNNAKELIAANVLYSEREIFDAQCPTGVGIITVGVDVQQGRLEGYVWGWGKNEQSWLIDHFAIYEEPNLPNAWNTLTTYLARQYKNAKGALIPVSAVAIDSGYATDLVYRYVKEFRSSLIIAVKGSSDDSRPILSQPTYIDRAKLPLYIVGTDSGKDAFFARVNDRKDTNLSFVHIPQNLPSSTPHDLIDLELEVCEQLMSEHRVVDYGKRKTSRYIKKRDRNEALDCTIYAMAALRAIRPPVISHLEKFVEQVTGMGGGEAAPQVSTRQAPEQVSYTEQMFRQRMGRNARTRWNKGFNL